MAVKNLPLGVRSEEMLAELAAAVYRVARQHDFKGAFIDAELDVWQALPPPARLKPKSAADFAQAAA